MKKAEDKAETKNIFEVKSLIGEPKRKSLFDKSEPLKAPSEQLPEEKSHEQKSLNLLERKQNAISKKENKKNLINRTKDYIDDTLTAYDYYKQMNNTAKKLVNTFGKNVGAGNGIDNYYHPLLQCVLAQKGNNHAQNGIELGYWKEVWDYYRKKGKMPEQEIYKDSFKDLQNNRYGSNLGKNNPDNDCRNLLEDRRTPNMKKLGIR